MIHLETLRKFANLLNLSTGACIHWMDQWILSVLLQPTVFVTEIKERKYGLKLHLTKQRPKTRISINFRTVETTRDGNRLASLARLQKETKSMGSSFCRNAPLKRQKEDRCFECFICRGNRLISSAIWNKWARVKFWKTNKRARARRWAQFVVFSCGKFYSK